MHGCVFLCPRNARVALACGSWRATTTRALRNRLLGSRDPLLRRSILRTTLHIYYSPRHSRPHRSSISLAWNGRTVFVVANVNRQTNVPPLWFTFITSSFESSFRAESRQNDRVTSYSRDAAVCFSTGKSNSFQFMNGN